MWGAPILSCSREIESVEATTTVVIDRLESVTPRSVAFYVQSEYPWRRDERGWYTEGARGRLRVNPEWDPVEETGGEDFVLGTKAPGYRLALKAKAGKVHELRTRLVVEPVR